MHRNKRICWPHHSICMTLHISKEHAPNLELFARC